MLSTNIPFSLFPNYGHMTCLMIRTSHPYFDELYSQSVSQWKFYLQATFSDFFFSLFAPKVRKLTNRKIVDLWNWFIGGMQKNFELWNRKDHEYYKTGLMDDSIVILENNNAMWWRKTSVIMFQWGTVILLKTGLRNM